MAIEEFVFEGYRYDPTRSTLSLCYSFNEGPRFEEQLLFDFVPQQLSGAAREVLDRLFSLILLLSGVSYYKAFIPKVLRCRAFRIDETTAEFLQKFYEKGFQVVIYGKKDHAEVIGLVGQTNGEAIVIKSVEEIEKLDLSRKTVLFSQTTMDKPTFLSKTKEADHDLFALVKKHGGSISAEHGIGTAKTRWLHLSRSDAELAAMRAIKHALDQNGILNPNVLVRST